MKFSIKNQSFRILALFVFLFSFTGFSQTNLSAEAWQNDLRFLQEKIHKDYSFLFKKVKAKDFDAEVEAFYAAIPEKEEHEIKVGLTRMVSFFEYGHTQIPFRTLASDAVLPVNLYHFEDGIYVEGVQKEDKKALGAKLIKVGNFSVEKALKAIRPVVPAENDSYFKGYGLRFLTLPAVLHAQGVLPEYSNSVTLTLKKDGKVFEHEFNSVPLSEMSRDYGFTTPNETWLSARDQNTTPLFLKHLTDMLYFFEYLEATKTVYVRQSSVFSDEKEPLREFYTRLFDFLDTNAVEKLIYDVRLNGGGNNYNNKPLIKGIMARPKLNRRGAFFYIIGRNTFSAAQNLTNEIENYTEAIIVGEPTSENKNFYGDANKVTLPNSKIDTYLSYAWWQDRPQWENKDWTIPHLAAAMTFNDYVNNNDVVLDVALMYSEGGFIFNPMDHLTELFVAGKYDQVRTDGAKIANDPAYKYFDFKKEFAEAGYRLLNYGNPEGGLYILQLVSEIYPESAGALFNFAMAQEQLKQLDKAKENYKKVFKMDSKGMYGKSAKKKLEKLNEQ